MASKAEITKLKSMIREAFVYDDTIDRGSLHPLCKKITGILDKFGDLEIDRLKDRLNTLEKNFNDSQNKDKEEPEKTAYNVINQGKEMWVNEDELNHALQQGKIDMATYNRIITQSKRKEPDYLQVGDQWRDEEGNEYVLISVAAPRNDGPYECDFYATLIDKETGEHLGRHITWFPNNDIYSLQNNSSTLYNLGVTDNMEKIK